MATNSSFSLSSHQPSSTNKTTTMSPLDVMQNDAYFLSLVSSQRQLLNQLNMETALKREQEAQGRRPAKLKRGGSMLGMDVNSFMNHPFADRRGSLIGGDPHSLMNLPISERRTSIDLIFSKRLSIGMGYDGFMLPPMFPELEKTELDETSVKGDMDYGDVLLRKAKRRRSSLGLSFFLDDPKQARRFSMLSFSKPLDGNEGDDIDDVSTFEQPPVEPPTKRIRLDPNVDIATLKTKLEACADAMEKSAQSQQDIHDWDRKMGLKKSHSKTMRLSSRSRKKLRSMFKKQINQLASHVR